MKHLFYTLVALLIFTSMSFAQRNKTYNALSFGYGTSYGGLGVMYEHRVGSGGFHLGLGYLSAPQTYAEPAYLFNVGYKAFFDNDMYFDIQFGGVGTEATQQWKSEFSYYGYSEEFVTEQQTLYGVSGLLGKTFWFSGDKVGINLAIGTSYVVTKVEWVDMTFVLAADLGLSVRI